MNVKDKMIVVTGAGSGIGRCMVRTFIGAGARHVVAADIDQSKAEQTAAEFGASPARVDVTQELEISSMIEDVEKEHGAIDLFCSNAGLAIGHSEQSPNSEWQLSWDVNVMSHVYAARHLLPRMIKRGGGYFLNTASAAGLLNQVGGAAYGVTKHAAVGFGEWLALTYRHLGIKVSMLCPQAVRTPMTISASEGGSGGVQAAAQNGMMEPEQVAECALQGLQEEQFLILPHPEVTSYMQRKTSDYDRWISGMNRLHLAMTEETKSN
ncbi:MAG: SDR family NAD(P)-dependent oxidoreductase [Pseudomonadota bacterium]